MREEFERWAADAPREWPLERYTEDEAWPGSYKDYPVQCAWEAWQEVYKRLAERIVEVH